MRKKRSFATPWVGPMQDDGFCLHDCWPAALEVQKACRRGEAARFLNHTGWFSDSFQDGMFYACAVQVRIPRRLVVKGDTRVRWLEAVEHSDWDAIRISRKHLHEELRDCIRSADDTARYMAEKAREDDERQQAEQQIDDARQAIQDTRAMIRRVLGARKQLAMVVPEVCEDLGRYVGERLAEVRKHRKRIALLERDPWQAVAW